MAGEDVLRRWVEDAEGVAREAGLDPREAGDARVVALMAEAGKAAAALTDENEALRRRVRRLEHKLFAIINMASDVRKYAERALDKKVSPDE